MLSMTRICQVNATQIFSKHVMVAQAACPSMCTLRSHQITIPTSTVPVRRTRTAYRRGFKTTGHDLEWSVEYQKSRSRNISQCLGPSQVSEGVAMQLRYSIRIGNNHRGSASPKTGINTLRIFAWVYGVLDQRTSMSAHYRERSSHSALVW